MPTAKILFLVPASAITRLFPQMRDAGIEAALAENLKGALAFIQKTRPVLIVARPTMPGFMVEDLLEQHENLPPIIITTDKGSPQEAERLLNAGAHDYWTEPLQIPKLATLLKTLPQQTAPGFTSLGGHKPEIPAAPLIIGSHPSVQRVLALAKQVAPSKASVLISGESGTGKEMFAKTLHALSDRANGPFIAINCAALPEHLLESELFGHEKGAFTGAISRKLGKFELATGGTLLLDEISEMDYPLQAKLLRVLQEGELDRVGGTETIKVDVRVLATTNREMETWVKEGKFRQDLYFRLNVIPLRLPALRERGEDGLELAHFFLTRYSKEYKLPFAGLSPEATEWIQTYEWPGNVRELQNLMERAVLLAGGKPIQVGHFLLEADTWPLFVEEEVLPQAAETQTKGDAENQEVASALLSAVPAGSAIFGAQVAQADVALFSDSVIPLHEMERMMIQKGLVATNGNRTQAAELLGISVRTLRNKLSEYRESGMPLE